MGSIERRLGRLPKLTDEDRDDLRADLIEVFESAEKVEDLDAMESTLMDMERLNSFEDALAAIQAANAASAEEAEEVVAEETSVEEAAVEEPAVEEPVVEEAAVEAPVEEAVAEPVVEEAVAEVKAEAAPEAATETPEAELSPAEAVVAEAESVIEAVAPVDIEIPASVDEPVQENTESEVVAMAASIVDTDDTADRAPIVASIHTTPRAGADIPGVTAGSEYNSISEVNDAMVNKINSIRGSHGGDGEKRTVVSLHAPIPEERQLSNANTNLNMERIEAITTPTAITASGGFCAPLPVNYDIFGVGSNDRPVRDSLPTFGATRGGIRYIQPPVLGAYTGGISLWTAANDANPTSPTTKPNLKVTCAAEATATTDAVTLSLTFGNLMSRAFPELVQRHNQLALIQHARFAERSLLNKIGQASTPVTSSYVSGSGRDFMISISRAAAAYRNRNRIPRGVQLRAIVPEWVRDSIREDIASNLRIENLAVADATIDTWLSARGVRITWHMDDTFEAQTTGSLNDFPSNITWWLFAEGTFLFLDGGTLDLGVVRDATLVGTNDYQTFVETFEGIAKVGIESLQITTTTGVGPVSDSSSVTHANTVQSVTIVGTATAGTFTLSYGGQTTAPIAYNATGATVATALAALSTIGNGNVIGTGNAGGPYTLTFQGALKNQPIAALTANYSALTGATGITVAVTVTGH